MSAIRFFHMADLHLDSPFKGLFGLPEKNLKKFEQVLLKHLIKLFRRQSKKDQISYSL